MSVSSLPFLLYETLEVGEITDVVPAYGTYSMAQHRLSTWPFLYHDVDSVRQIKKLCGERRQSIKNFEIFLVDSLCGYCCEPSQRTGNRLVLLNVHF
jgi:hypothetical protein